MSQSIDSRRSDWSQAFQNRQRKHFAEGKRITAGLRAKMSDAWLKRGHDTPSDVAEEIRFLLTLSSNSTALLTSVETSVNACFLSRVPVPK
jgi:hypothetical protein